MGYMKELDIRIEAAKVRCTQALASEGMRAHDMAVVGSTYIECKNTSDIDVLCLVHNREFGPDVSGMSFYGWEYGGSVGEGNDDDWGSWKRTFSDAGEVNMLVTSSVDVFKGWVDAAEVCKLLATCGIVVSRAVKCGIHDILMEGLCVDEVMVKQNPVVPL
jgi:hypothetical protein